MNNLVIGIEGHVGAGKTAICKELLNKIPNSILLQGGNLYRGIAYALLRSGANLEELKQNMKQTDIKQIMEKLKIQIAIENRDTVIYMDGKKIEEELLQSTDSSLAVSEISNVADNQNFYLFGRTLIEQFKERLHVIVSGRDLMKIYPNLDYHFLVTASLEERVRRKCIKYNNTISQEEVRQNIIQRDKVQEQSGYYRQYENTILVDVTDCETIEKSAKEVLKYIKEV
ncbi:MAG: hypothetical protein HFJ30_05675 [Clostridia bacterium]|jgi:cytidylate kinase|nr:hypothetical protein [Clostridia bacterium]MCI9413426.1 hypothetical protein [Clostridia bacterium]